MSGATSGRPVLYLAPDEPDQVPRLARFRRAHPDVIIGDGGFGTLQGRIPNPSGEVVTTRYTLRELLDRLDELTGPDSGSTTPKAPAPATGGTNPAAASAHPAAGPFPGASPGT